MGWIAALLIVHAQFAQAGQNLLRNPGMEEPAGVGAAAWDLFVLPQEGALGRVDAAARSGARALLLHTPLPYAEDPANNWSQNVFADVAGQRLRVGGFIRPERATDAAIWVQCWRRQPLRLLKTINTGAAQPVNGTGEWREVAAEFDVPFGADFLTVRCVLRGAGSAWFDDLFLERAAAPAPAPGSVAAAPVPLPGSASAPADAALRDATQRPEPPAMPVMPAMPSRTGGTEAAPAAGSIPPAAVSALADLTRITRENEALIESLRSLQATQDALHAELSALRDEVRQLRAAPSAPAPSPAAPSAAKAPPPLVPRGESWEGTP